MNFMDLKNYNIIYGKTIEEWAEKYKGIPLRGFSITDVLNDSVKLDKNMCYWYIDEIFYETLDVKKKVPAKRPPKKHESNDVVNKPDTFEEIRQAELANAINILHDNGCIAVTIDEYQSLTNQTNTEVSSKEPRLEVSSKEPRLYVLYEGEFGGYIARVCNDSPSVTSLVKVQSQLAEDGYWVSKVCSSSTDNEIFIICYKEGD